MSEFRDCHIINNFKRPANRLSKGGHQVTSNAYTELSVIQVHAQAPMYKGGVKNRKGSQIGLYTP